MSPRRDDYWEGFLTGATLVGFAWALTYVYGVFAGGLR